MCYEKKQYLIQQIQNVFQKNNALACYVPFLNVYLCDNLFHAYADKYLHNLNLNDVAGIQQILEKMLNVKLSDFVNLDELMKIYFFSKSYIELILQEKQGK